MEVRKRSHTTYCKAKDGPSRGIEVYETVKRNGKKHGQIAMRFFIEDCSQEQIRFIMGPAEAFAIYLKIGKVFRATASCKESFVHKVEREEQKGKGGERRGSHDPDGGEVREGTESWLRHHLPTFDQWSEE